MIKEILEENIYYYKDVIPNSNEFIKEIERLDLLSQDNTHLTKWMTWVSSNDPNDIFGEYKSGSFTPASPNNDIDARYALIVSTILDAINLCVKDYSDSLDKDLGFLPNEITIRKYFPPAQMGPHIDCEEDDEEARLTASIVLYLNDDYTGGDLAFPEQGIKIKPEAGSLVIFPSVKPYFHASTPLVSGNKYMCPAFMFKRSKIISQVV